MVTSVTFEESNELEQSDDCTDTRPCCNESTCPREEISKWLNPDAPESQRVRRAACKVAAVCGSVTRDSLRECFSIMFEAPPECRLCDEFVLAYETERDALEGQRALGADAS